MTKPDLTIVMYHYIREIKASAYPRIKGLEVNDFRRQLDYLSKTFTIITAEQLLAVACGEEENLPLGACLLTFDDGYKDHIQYVLPELKKRNLQGSFFPPARPILNGELLDVNAIHYILACVNEIKVLIDDLFALCVSNGITHEELATLWSKLAKPSRWDEPEIIFVKRMLQKELPEEIRHKITNNLFEKHMQISYEEFSRELYMSKNDIKVLISEGMYIGSHTYDHPWLNTLEKSAQENQIDRSIDFLRDVGAPVDNWIMCYPYGAYNDDTLSILRKRNCSIGLTTKVGSVSFSSDNLLELKRYDTNDFPQ